MPVELFHTLLGVTFVIVWAMIGQLAVSRR